MTVGGIDVSDPENVYKLQYMVLAFLLLGLAFAGLAAYATTTSYKHGNWGRLVVSSLMWVIAAADVVYMIYIGYLQSYPIINMSWLLMPWWMPLVVYGLALFVFTLFGWWRAGERHPRSSHGR